MNLELSFSSKLISLFKNKISASFVNNPGISTAKTLINLPGDFVILTDIVPDVLLEIRYYSTYNFVGKRIDSYNAPVAILSRKAAMALSKASNVLIKQGYIIKIFDAYRPQSAVNHFIEWSKRPDDISMKTIFYPNLEKERLFDLDYICKRSSHSRGSTVDMTVIDIKTGLDLDTGSPFDLFSDISHHGSTLINKQQFLNRIIIKKAMEESGFEANPHEWWHYTLQDEPYPNSYFDFPVELYN